MTSTVWLCDFRVIEFSMDKETISPQLRHVVYHLVNVQKDVRIDILMTTEQTDDFRYHQWCFLELVNRITLLPTVILEVGQFP